MKITILFASYNGEARLPRMLEALTHIDYPAGAWQVIAVDNNSKDTTLEVLRSWQDRLPLTVLSEPTQGKSHALNTGLDAAPKDTGLFILTDDDVIPDPQWLNALVKAATTHPDYDIFGGEIQPAWERRPEDWIMNWVNLRMIFAINQDTLGGEINPDLVFGPNSAFRGKIFLDEGVRVPTHIGPRSGGSYPMGNDSALAKLLSDKGHKAWHVPEAIVQHMIPARNMTEEWIIQRAERFGWGMVVQHPEWFDDYRPVSVAWLKKRLKYALHSCLYYPVKLLPKSRRRFNFIYWVYYQKGVFKGIREERRA